jgi:hypothetical protein
VNNVACQVPGADHPLARVLVFDHALRTHNRVTKAKRMTNPDHGWGVHVHVHVCACSTSRCPTILSRITFCSAACRRTGGYANVAHTDATVRSLHSRCKDQVLGTTETVVKYQGTYPAGWGEVRPTLAWQERLFRAEELDHDSPRGVGACARV